MANSVLRQTIHTSLAKTLMNEVAARSAKYYFSYGKTDSWGTTSVPDALDTVAYDLEARKNTVFMKEVAPSDVCLVIPRHNWVYGSVYDDYDYYTSSSPSYSGAFTLEEAIFYVVTDEYNVYKCLFNNNSSASTIKPTGTAATEFRTEDNYIWKFMYTIPTFLRNKFLSSTQMPVTNAIQNAYYSDGKLEKFVISSKGSGYLANENLTGTVFTNSLNYREIFGSGTAFSDELQVNDYIVINGEVRKVGTINSDTKLTLAPDQPMLYLPSTTSVKKLNTYIEITDGDGYKDENPYILTSITLTNPGSGYGTDEFDVSVVFSDPTLPNGRIAQAEAIVASNGMIDSIIITDPGYGYEVIPKITIVDNRSAPLNTGHGATAVAEVVKTKAYIDPVIDDNTGQVLNVNVVNPGIGYTYATIAVRRLTERDFPIGVTAWEDAAITADVSTGRINTKQADVELSAVNGAIHVIKVTNGGSGYASATITVSGDGTGCTAVPVIENGVITRINVVTPGKDYTYANISVASPGAPAVQATARAIVAPSGGHGKSAIDELFGRTILFFNRLDVTPVKGFTIASDYRQICLYKQPKSFGSQLQYSGFIGSTAYKITVEIGSSPALSTIPLNSILEISQTSTSSPKVKFKLIARSTTQLLLQAIDNNDEIVRTGYVLKHSNGVNYYSITVVEKPDVEKLSGDIIYIDNRQPFKPLADQSVSISSRFKL